MTQKPQPSPAPGTTVFVVDDDPSVRRSVLRLLHTAGLAAQAFASACEFLAFRTTTASTHAEHLHQPEETAVETDRPPNCRHTRMLSRTGGTPTAECLVLDICMPVMSGLSLQEELAGRHDTLPIVFITGHGDVPSSVQAMKNGAVDFLTKPFDQQDLLNAIAVAISRSQALRQTHDQRRDALRRLETLTAREREVLERVVTGVLNKQIALEFGISEPTVKVHRGRVMEKMAVTSVAELVRVFDVATRTAPGQK